MGSVLKPVASSAGVRESSSKHTHTVPIGMPEELFVSHDLPTSAQLSWTPVPKDKQNDVITGYTVQVEGPDITQEIPITSEFITSVEISDLSPSTQYNFEVSTIRTESQRGENSMPLCTWSISTCIIIILLF